MLSRYTLIGILIILPIQLAYPQGEKKISNYYRAKLQKADQYFKAADYQNAILIYNEFLSKFENDTSVLCKNADAYRLLNDSKNAEDFYRKAITGNEKTIDPKFLLFFGQMLTINNKYDEALYWYREYYKSRTSDIRALESIKSLENISEMHYDTTFYVVYPININTEFSEFCPAFYKTGIFFLSDRESKTAGFYSWYYSIGDSSGIFSETAKFSKKFKTEYNEGPAAFYDHYTKMIFSQNYFKGKMNKKSITEIPLQLFSARQDSSGEWKDVTILPFIDNKYSYSQPTITEDGQFLYFSSNLPGGYGGADLYQSKYVNNTWTDPVNLGSAINSPGDEMFPYIFQDSILFFSSNGHGGLGGLDIFKVNLNNPSTLQNFVMPINSSKDDFGFIEDKDGLSGYLSSDRVNGKGADDVYGFKQIRISISIRIIDELTQEPVSNAELYSLSDDKYPIGITDKDGSCTLIIPVYEVFKVKIKKENYESRIYTFQDSKTLSKSRSVIPIQITTEPEEKIILTDENNKEIENPKDVIYKVQVFASRKEATDKELMNKYKGGLTINKSFEDNWHKYTIGEYNTYLDAKKTLMDCNVYDAFIAAYMQNKRVYIVIAKTYTNEIKILSPIRRK